MSNSETLRRLFRTNETEYVVEAHNGLNAQILEKSGFKAVWVSARGIWRHPLAVKSEGGWIEFNKVLEVLCESVRIPVVVNCDVPFKNPAAVNGFVDAVARCDVSGVILPGFENMGGVSRYPEREARTRFLEWLGKIRNRIQSRSAQLIVRSERFLMRASREELVLNLRAVHHGGADLILFDRQNELSPMEWKAVRECAKRLPVALRHARNDIQAFRRYRALGFRLFFSQGAGVYSLYPAMKKLRNWLPGTPPGFRPGRSWSKEGNPEL